MQGLTLDQVRELRELAECAECNLDQLEGSPGGDLLKASPVWMMARHQVKECVKLLEASA